MFLGGGRVWELAVLILIQIRKYLQPLLLSLPHTLIPPSCLELSITPPQRSLPTLTAYLVLLHTIILTSHLFYPPPTDSLLLNFIGQSQFANSLPMLSNLP